MTKDDQNGWKIVNEDLPPWIYEVEPKLGESIETGDIPAAPSNSPGRGELGTSVKMVMFLCNLILKI
jgi:hypothetical protein